MNVSGNLCSGQPRAMIAADKTPHVSTANDCTLLTIRQTLPASVYWVGRLEGSVEARKASTCLHHSRGNAPAHLVRRKDLELVQLRQIEFELIGPVVASATAICTVSFGSRPSRRSDTQPAASAAHDHQHSVQFG
jgi:hypothetical protein